MSQISSPAISLARVRIAELCVLALFGSLAFRGFYLATDGSEFLQNQANARMERTLTLPAERGRILDRNSEILAANEPAYDIWGTVSTIQGLKPKTKKALSDILGVPEVLFDERLKSTSKKYIPLARAMKLDSVNLLALSAIKGVDVRFSGQRSYPQGASLAPYLGTVNGNMQGVEGIERAFEGYLMGVNGQRTVLRDAKGRIIDQPLPTVEPVHGKDLHLTLDNFIQHEAYSVAQEAKAEHRAKSVSVVVLDPNTGDVLALASTLTQDPKEFKGTFPVNPAINQAFEPGSTFKPFTLATALDLKRTRIDEIFNVTSGSITITGKTVGDSHPSLVPLTLEGVLQKSSNVGTVMVGMRLSPLELYNTYEKAGFLEKPAPHLPSQSNGLVRNYKNWRPIEQATMAYGHGVGVSALQLARAYCAFAREDGQVPNLRITQDDPLNLRPLFSPDTVAKLRKMLQMAASSEGTAKAAQTDHYTVAGKTGTARKNQGGAYMQKYLSSFVGFAPANNPRVVVAVMVDEPTGAYYGGIVAAPSFSKIVSRVLPYLEVKPDIVAELSEGETVQNYAKKNR